MKAVMLLGVIALTAGCSDGGSEPPAAVPDPTPNLPVVTLMFECFGECGALQPPALPSVAVYPDGTTVTAQFEDGNHLTTRRGTVSRDAVVELEDLARAADLEGDGVLPELPLPDGIGIADGGGSVFSFRSGSEVATRNVPHLYDTDDFNSEGLRAEYLQLQEALLALPQGQTWEWSQEALLVERLAKPPAATDPEWDGPDFGQRLEDTALGECTITSSLGPLMANSTFEREFSVDGEVWTVVRRPLLPHEDACVDIDDFSRAR